MPPEQRARLAESLLESLQQEADAEVEAAWEQEIQARVNAYRKGEEGVIDGEMVSFHIPMEELTEICRRYHVQELALFGSRLREGHHPDSDVDLLVSFDPAARITFSTLARMQRELAALLQHKVDLVPKDGLKPLIRDHVLASARVLYAA